MQTTRNLLALACLVSLLLSATQAGDWPHWRGPFRNDHSSESSGLRRAGWLPEKPVWVRQSGEGSSSPVVVGDRLFTLGWKDGHDVLSCLDVKTGDERWNVTYEAPRYGRHAVGDQGLYSGPTSTPEYDVELDWLYTLSCDGDLQAWDVSGRTASNVWKRNLYDEYDIPRRPKVGRSGLRDYGYTSSPLVIGDTLIVEVGAKEATLFGYDRRTGRELWRSQANDPAGHNGGPVPITVDGVPCVAVHHFNGLLVVRLDGELAGRTVAEYDWLTDFGNNIATPAVHGNSILLTSSYNQHRIARLDVSLSGATKKWEQEEASKVCSPIVHRGSVYWAWRQMVCLDFETGRVRWKGGRYGDPGSCIATKDDRLIVWANRGELVLVDTAVNSPDQYSELSRRDGNGRSDAWPHVVLSNRRLFCKDRTGQITCFSLNDTPVTVTRSMPTSPSPRQAASSNSEPRVPNRPPLKQVTVNPETPLVFAWQGGPEVIVPEEVSATTRLRPRSDAQLDKSGIRLNGGAVIVDGAQSWLHSPMIRSGEFSLEAVIKPASLDQRGPARIISQSADAYRRNFTVGQEGEWLVIRLRTSESDENGRRNETRICRLKAGERHHLVISYRNGQLLGYLNGEEVARREIRGTLNNWAAFPFLIGDEWNGGRPWKGTISQINVYSRVLNREAVTGLYRQSR